jgi:uncharacterized membrane protein
MATDRENDIERRVKKLESHVAAINCNLALLEYRIFIKFQIDEIRDAIIDFKNSVIIWSVSSAFISKLLAEVLDKMTNS